MAIEVRFTVWLPVAVTVIGCAALVVPVFWVAKVSDVGLKPSVVDATCPVPLRATDCGEPVALSANVSAAVRVPAAVGEKVTLTVQLAPAASVAPQVLALIA